MSGKPNKDQRIVSLLAHTLLKLDDFAGKEKEAEEYAAEVVHAARAAAADVEEFKDHVMGIAANVVHLNGDLVAGGITPTDLATMQLHEILSRKQKQEQAALSRKRVKEQIDYDKTSMLCRKCGLIRADRLNINELALDSAESGSHFDYNFDNVCNCSHSSSDEDSDSVEDAEDNASPKAKRPKAEGLEEQGTADEPLSNRGKSEDVPHAEDPNSSSASPGVGHAGRRNTEDA